MKIAERILSKSESKQQELRTLQTRYDLTGAEDALKGKKAVKLNLVTSIAYAKHYGIDQEFGKHSDKIMSLLQELEKARYDAAEFIKQHAEQKRKELNSK